MVPDRKIIVEKSKMMRKNSHVSEYQQITIFYSIVISTAHCLMYHISSKKNLSFKIFLKTNVEKHGENDKFLP